MCNRKFSDLNNLIAMTDCGTRPKHGLSVNCKKYLSPIVNDIFTRGVQVLLIGVFEQATTFKPFPVESRKIRCIPFLVYDYGGMGTVMKI